MIAQWLTYVNKIHKCESYTGYARQVPKHP